MKVFTRLIDFCFKKYQQQLMDTSLQIIHDIYVASVSSSIYTELINSKKVTEMYEENILHCQFTDLAIFYEDMIITVEESRREVRLFCVVSIIGDAIKKDYIPIDFPFETDEKSIPAVCYEILKAKQPNPRFSISELKDILSCGFNHEPNTSDISERRLTYQTAINVCTNVPVLCKDIDIITNSLMPDNSDTRIMTLNVPKKYFCNKRYIINSDSDKVRVSFTI